VKWTAEDDRRLRELHAQGMKYAAIGRRMNRTANQVGDRCQHLGLTRVTRELAAKRKAVAAVLLAQGMTHRAVAERLGVGRTRVTQISQELGLPKRRSVG